MTAAGAARRVDQGVELRWEGSARLLSLLSLFQAQRDWSGRALADRLGVSPRTIRRDVERLRAMGYDVDATKGPEGGYRLGAGKALPPLLFRPVPRAAAIRGVRVQRPLGVFIPTGTSFIDDISSLRDALQDKGSKYGELEHALVLAINVGSSFHDVLDTEQALCGTVGWRFDYDNPDAEPWPVLTEPGYWGWPGQPAHTNVAGVLLAEGMHYGRVGTYVPVFWEHPHATKPIEPLPIWLLAQESPAGTVFSEPLKTPNEHFGLPIEWPVRERFPRGHDEEQVPTQEIHSVSPMD